MIVADILASLPLTLLIASLVYLPLIGAQDYLFHVIKRGNISTYVHFAKRHEFKILENPTDANYNGVVWGKPFLSIAGQHKETKRNVKVVGLSYTDGKTEFPKTVAEIQIKPSKIHCFVNSKMNEFQGQFLKLHNSQRYTAESDFGKYFDIYMKPEDRNKSLSLFAPDALSLIMGEYGEYDIEIINDKLFVYNYGLYGKTEELESFLATALKLAKELDTNAPQPLMLTESSNSSSKTTHALNPGKRNYKLAFIVTALYCLFSICFLSRYRFSDVVTIGGRSYSVETVYGNISMLTIAFAMFAPYIAGWKNRIKYKKDRQKYAS